MEDRFDLQRFVAAQESGRTYQQALRELRQGRKVSHWMWFVFPQLAGLGRSAMAQGYALSSLDEAGAYLEHETLGPRLVECSSAVARHQGLTAERFFGGVDATKLRSSMTLFDAASGHGIFQQVLDHYFDGIPDPVTVQLLAGQARA